LKEQSVTAHFNGRYPVRPTPCHSGTEQEIQRQLEINRFDRIPRPTKAFEDMDITQMTRELSLVQLTGKGPKPKTSIYVRPKSFEMEQVKEKRTSEAKEKLCAYLGTDECILK
jgi:hypothetical protein